MSRTNIDIDDEVMRHAHSARLHTRNADDLRGVSELIEVVPV